MKKIKVHYYIVTAAEGAPPLETALAVVKSKALADRILISGTQKVRLDDVFDKVVNEQIIWSMKFTRIHDDNWPGVVASAQETKDLELDEDQLLSEETFAAYHPASKRLVVQYNHRGVRAPKIKDYLNAQTDHKYDFIPVLTDEATDKYHKKTIVTALEVALTGVSDADVEIMAGSGIQAALRQSVSARATTFYFKAGVDARLQRNRMDRGWVETIVDAVKRRGGDNDTIVVSAKENEEDTVEAIDLLEARKVTKYNADDVGRTLGRRLEPDHMHGLMEQSLREWITST